MNILELKNVNKRFGGIKAVADLSIKFEMNKVHGIIGPNGAGKTTVFNLITNFIKTDSGEIFFKGQRITKELTHKIVKLGLCRSYQDIRLFNKLKVIENVYIGLPNQKYDKIFKAIFGKAFEKSKERKINIKKAEELLDESNLLDSKDMMADKLSYGQQKLIMMNRILATGAELILLDEPTAGLDGKQIEDVIETIRDLISKDKTIILVEHNIDVIMAISDFIYVLDQGMLVAQGSKKDIYKNETVLQTYMGE
jgi:branched-chain amino acid transport system ATP-binding protein